MNAPPLPDTREAQAERAADFMALHPEGSTLAEIDAAADLGSPTKVLSAMRRELGYGIRRGPNVPMSLARDTTAEARPAGTPRLDGRVKPL